MKKILFAFALMIGLTSAKAQCPSPFNVSGGGSVCPGQTVTITLSGSEVGASYLLRQNGGNVPPYVNGTGGPLAWTVSSTGTYTIVGVRNGCSQYIPMTGSAIVTVNANPTVYNVLASPVNICEGSGASSNIIVNGSSQTNVYYQLRFNGSNTGSPIQGNGGQISWSVTTPGAYTVVATSTAGCTSNMSGTATVTVSPLPTLFTVSGGGNICEGQAVATVTLSGSQTEFRYQLWNGSMYGEKSGTGGALTWTISAGGTYTVRAYSLMSGCSRYMTGEAVLNVGTLPQAHSVRGGGAYCADSPGRTVYVSPTEIGVNYQLKINGVDSGDPKAGTGGGLEWPNQTTPAVYSIEGTNATTGCKKMMTNTVTISVNPASPNLYTAGGGGAICYPLGAGATITLNGSQSGINYYLKLNGANVIDGGVRSGTGSALSWSGITEAGTYTVQAVNMSCTRMMTGSPTVVVNPNPAMFPVSGGGPYCSGAGGLNVVLQGSETGVNYQLVVNGASSGSPLVGTGSALTWAGQTTSGTYTVTATNASTGCMRSNFSSVSISAHPLPFAYTVGGGGYYCAGNLYITLSGSETDVSYQLRRDGVNVGMPSGGTGGILSWGGQSATGTYTVVATRQSTGCSNPMNGSATITNFAPGIFSVGGGGAYCAGSTGPSVTLSGSQTGVRYQLKIGGMDIGSYIEGTGGALSWNNVQTPGAAVVWATDPNSGCLQIMPTYAVITVNPLPQQFATGGTGAYCAGAGTVTLSGSQAGVHYQLKHGATDTGSPLPGTGTALSWNNLTDAGTYTIIATHGTTGCYNTMTGSAMLTINALPTQYALTGGGTICFGGSGVSFSLSGSQAAVNYQLRVDDQDIGAPVAGNGSALQWTNQTAPGIYTVRATNTTPCSSIMNGTPALEVITPPQVITGPTQVGGTPVTLTVNAAPGYTYQWKQDGSNITVNGQSASLGVTEPGSYQVESAGNGCSWLSAPHFVARAARKYYNGTIAAVRWRTDKTFGSTENGYTGMYTYDYDNKYQIKEATWAVPDFTLGTFVFIGHHFRVAGIAYDANGNILSMKRYDAQGSLTNNFTYTYQPHHNKLTSVSGYVNAYTYNEIGQMTGEDKVENDKDQYIEYDGNGKVSKVFSDAAMQNLKVEFIYDERGFRAAKFNAETNKTTWYFRDVVGKVLAVYEQDGAVSVSNPNAAIQTEVGIYGASKLGTSHPQQEGSTNYELTDHLGSVRAIVRDNINTLTATMEDNDQADITNPRVEELSYFNNLFETEFTDAFMNVSEPIPAVVDNPDKVAYLFWNDNVGTQAADKAVGPAVALQVRAGDRLNIDTWARYEEKLSFAKDFELVALAGFLGNTFTTLPGFDGVSATEAASNIQGALSAAGYQADDEDDSRPYAYLNYIVYDEDMVMQDAGWIRVPEEAGSDQSALYLPQNKPVRIAFDTPVEIAQDGYIYVWVSNQSKNSRVWFDNLSVTHEGAMVVQATDYGPWGDVIREQKTDEAAYRYRYGYQGQFAERDLETGWSYFELRQYDAIIGRWTTVDPKRIGFSPYIGMANNPIKLTDPDGGGPNDWYTDQWGNLVYNSNVKSQEDVDRLGGGRYVGESFSDGKNAYLPNGGVLNLETGQFTETNFIRSFTTPLYGRSVIYGYDYQKAIDYLNTNAKSEPVGYCARWVRWALEAGGLSTEGRPNAAKDYNGFLLTLGFKEVPVTTNYVPMAGDIAVMQNIGEHIYGHIQMFNGEKWISDYKQNGFWPYTLSRPTYQIFR